MWIVVISDSYYPKVFYFNDYKEAKDTYDEQISIGAVCYLAECKVTNSL